LLSCGIFQVHTMKNKARMIPAAIKETYPFFKPLYGLKENYIKHKGSSSPNLRTLIKQRNDLRYKVSHLEREGLEESDALAQELRKKINQKNEQIARVAKKHACVAGGFVATAFGSSSIRLILPILLQSVGGVFMKGVLSAYGKDVFSEAFKKRYPRFFACCTEKKSSQWSNYLSAGLVAALLTYFFEQHKEYEAQQKTLKDFEGLMDQLREIESNFVAVDSMGVEGSLLKEHYKQELMSSFQKRYATWVATLPGDILKAVELEELALRRRKIDQAYQESVDKIVHAQHFDRPLTEQDAKKIKSLDDLYETSLSSLRIPEKTNVRPWGMFLAKPSEYSQHSPAQLVSLVKDAEEMLKVF